ncbi:signal peptidase I [Verrucomicrobiaceae bacterium N1E253]|uniref:Signal peptidase I n=1 Tax=Oceaniferula marina TaxID=2748318 RepID=A0A851GL12_9BACT|nr:signal peptidase I [Oceaniferula marina]NWK54854.1 signal peptidase I [Oceaniferula marina]
MFAPKWKKEAKLLDKAAKKFLNYKRDLLEEKQIAEIESRRIDLRSSVKSGDKERTAEASKQLQSTCESALPRYQAQGWVEENIEVFFVAIVVALGLRAYVVQPFRIPTGSMQPTLNGIIATKVDSSDDFPALPIRTLQWATHGRSYVDLVLEEDKTLRKEDPIEEIHTMHFFTRTKIHFSDNTSVTFPGPKTALLSANGMGFGEICGYPPHPNDSEALTRFQQDFNTTPKSEMAYETVGKNKNPIIRPKLKAGTVIARGFIDSGDLILVDKMSYHFRKPKRSEVFVFDTREIKKIRAQANPGSHYIKRLAAVPGEELEIKGNDLYIDGQRAQDPGFLKVMSEREGYHYGYKPIGRLAHGRTFKAKWSKHPGMNEYIALGDNSFNSSDSRDWGTVKEFNVIGPASFSLWPFGSGHWGIIK